MTAPGDFFFVVSFAFWRIFTGKCWVRALFTRVVVVATQMFAHNLVNGVFVVVSETKLLFVLFAWCLKCSSVNAVSWKVLELRTYFEVFLLDSL